VEAPGRATTGSRPFNCRVASFVFGAHQSDAELRTRSDRIKGCQATPRPTRYSSLSLKRRRLSSVPGLAMTRPGKSSFPGGEGPSASSLCARPPCGQPSRALVEDLIQVIYLKLWKAAAALAGLCCPTSRSDFGIFKENCGQCHAMTISSHGRSQSSGGGRTSCFHERCRPRGGEEVMEVQKRIALEDLSE